MEKEIEHEIETVIMKGLYRDPSIQIVPTSGPKVCKCYLRWAIWISRERFVPRGSTYSIIRYLGFGSY